jgi:coenzyme PQQ synthesis protein D (PqqD)
MLSQDQSSSLPAPRARKDLLLQELGEEGLLHDREGSLVHIMNLTALFIWRQCDGTKNVSEIVDAVRGSFSGANGRDVRRDVEETLSQFLDRGLLERR